MQSSVHASRAAAAQRFFNEHGDVYFHWPVNINMRARIVQELVGPQRNASVLDVGCGDGRISMPFARAGNRVTLLDTAPRMLERAQALAGAEGLAVEAVLGDLAEYRTPRLFDVVLCLGVLAHVDSIPASLEALVRLTRPGGLLVIQLTDAGKLVARLQNVLSKLKTRFGRRSYDLNVMQEKEFVASAARLELERLADRRYSFLLPGMGHLPVRWLARFERMTLEIPSLSRHGSELIIAFRRR
jgi:SAM-dependent methyltransferase